VIGLDTNILVRFFMQDDHTQGTQVDVVMKSLTEAEPGWVGLAVLMELVWVLTSTYRTNRAELIRVLNHLLSRNEIVIEQAEAVRHAVRIYLDSNVGFADCLISSSARGAGCTQTLTFDQDAAKSAGMTLVR
jgi:predicted nucleic-acid-binding protein